MDNFLLGMLVMWFTYPLLSVLRELVAEKIVVIAVGSEQDNKTKTEKQPIGFKV
jgi:hypothetical protein